MRTILRFLLFAVIALSSGSAFASTDLKGTKEVAKESRMSNAEANRLLGHLHEIKGMDRSKLTTDQKRDLRKEVQNIKQQVSKNRPGYFIYISLTALIIILPILLLI